jgi:hypothetical protein
LFNFSRESAIKIQAKARLKFKAKARLKFKAKASQTFIMPGAQHWAALSCHNQNKTVILGKFSMTR